MRMQMQTIKKLSFSLAFSAMLSAMLFVFMASDVSAQPNPPDILGRSDKWLFGNLHLQKLYGQIGDATPGAEFGTTPLLIIIRQINNRITELEGQVIEGDTVYQLIVSDLFMFDKKITDNTYSVFIPMPSGYRLKPEGVFAAWIAGWDEYANVEILYGSGYMIEGFLFRRDDYPYLAGWDAHGFVQLEPWTPYGIQDVEMHTVVDETEILGLEKMNVGDVLTY